MRQSIILLIVFFLVSQASSQEIISNVISEGNEQRHILKEIDGTPYLVKISWLDSIYTYDLSEETAILLNTSYSSGSFYNAHSSRSNRWIVFTKTDGVTAYDFVNDKFVNFPNDIDFLDIYTPGSVWKKWEYGYSTLIQRMSNWDKKVFLLDSDLTVIDSSIVFDNLIAISEEHFIIKEIAGDSSQYSSIDRESFLEKHHLSLHKDDSQVVDDKNIVYTKNENSELWIYNIDEAIDSLIYTTIGNVSGTELSQIDDHFLFNFSTQNTNYSITINKSNLEITEFQGVKLNQNNCRSLDNSILYNFTEFNDSIYVYNYQSQSTSAFSSIYKSPRVITIAPNFILTKNVTDNILYDIHDNSSQTFEINIPQNYSLDIQSLKLQNSILIDLGTRKEEIHDLVTINLENKEVSNSLVIPFTKRGLVGLAEFYLTNTDIYVLNYGILHSIINDSLYRLVDHPIVYNLNSTYKEIREGIFWAERDSTNINFYYFKKEIKTLLATINVDPASGTNSFVPESFFLGNTHLHIFGEIDNDNALMLIDLESGESDFLQDLENKSIKPSSRSFFHDGYFYYLNGFNGIEILDEIGTLQTSNFDISDISLSNFTIHEDKCFLADRDGIYLVTGLNKIKIFDLSEETPYTPIYGKLGPYLTLSSSNDKYIFKDDQWLPLNLNLSNHDYLNDQYLITRGSIYEPQHISKIYDIDAGNYINLPKEIDSLKIIGVFENQETKYLLTLEKSVPKYMVNVFELNSNLEETILVNSFPINGRSNHGTFLPYKNEGLLFANSDLFLMNDNLDFIQLEVIINPFNYNKHVEDNGTFYFFGNDPDRGRQVYKVEAFSKVLDIEEVSWEKVDVYPNPTQYNINWSKENIETNIVQIHDQNGNLVLDVSEYDANSIDISMLRSGIYSIKIVDTNNQKVKTGRFIKI